MYVQYGFEGCMNHATCPGFSNFCKKHGGRYQCIHQDCCSIAQGRGLCITHGYKKRRCNIDGCNFQSVTRGLCKKHGLQQHCTVNNCTKFVVTQNMCHYHWRASSRPSREDVGGQHPQEELSSPTDRSNHPPSLRETRRLSMTMTLSTMTKLRAASGGHNGQK
jgi:hypothetical protein